MHPVSVDSCVPNLPRLGLRPHAPSPFGITKSWLTKRAEWYLVIDKGLGNEKGSRGNRPKSGTAVS